MLLLLMLFITLSIAKKEALIVVVSDYGNGEGAEGREYDLKGVLQDMYKMKAMLEQQWKFHVEILRDKNSLNLGHRLDGYATTLGNEDDFVLYFSGHGSQVEDKSGDEQSSDGKDETLVLSDGRVNRHFLDDELFGYLNEIQATKMIILDACHSGTAFKRFDDRLVTKSLSPKEVDGGVMVTQKHFNGQSKLSKERDYIVFSASRDNEKSLADSSGSLFTTALVEAFGKQGKYAGLHAIKQEVNQKILQICQAKKETPHHSQLSVSKDALEYTSVGNYFHSKYKIFSDKKGISIKSKLLFKEGDVLSFEINSHQNKGYITILVEQKGQVQILYQSLMPYQGRRLNYPNTLNAPIQYANLGCGEGCTVQHNMLYVLMTPTPVTLDSMTSTGDYPFRLLDSQGREVRDYLRQRFEIEVSKI